MKKIISLTIFCFIVILFSTMVFSASYTADDRDGTASPVTVSSSANIYCDTVMKGIVEVDGNLDDDYEESLHVRLKPRYHPNDSLTGICANVYALYDDNYVYVFYQVERDTTLMSANDDYIETALYPSLNDAVELRIGDDLEEHLPEYTGSNAAHHLFMMDAYGKRFSCYEDAMEDYTDLMKGASKITSPTSYNVEMAIPVVNPFSEGDIIQFNFQVDDCQDADEQKTGYIGLGKNYMTLIDFIIGGAVEAEPLTLEVSSKTAVKGSEISIPVVITSNPGINTMKVTLDYDKTALELTAVENGDVFSELEEVYLASEKPIIINTNALTNTDAVGTAFTLKFKVKENAALGEYSLTLTHDPEDVFNLDEVSIPLTVTNGKITVTDLLPGDANGDGTVNMKDSLLLRKHLAGWPVEAEVSALDVNGDDVVNMKDALHLRKYLAGWQVELG